MNNNYVQLLYKWLELKNIGVTIENFLKTHGIKSIAIYGAGTLGARLYNELISSDIEIKFIIDKNKHNGLIKDFNILHPNEITRLNSVELVIVTPFTNIYEIFGIMRNKTDRKIIGIDRIIEIMYNIEFYYSKLKQMQIEKEIKVAFVKPPSLIQIKNPTETELCYLGLSLNIGIERALLNPEIFQNVYKDVEEYSYEYIEDVFTPVPIVEREGKLVHIDVKRKFLNVINGKRVTTDIQNEYDNTVHFVGACQAMGYGVDDRRTIPSYLQRYINEDMETCKKYRVINYGIWGLSDFKDVFKIIQEISFSKGDILILNHFGNFTMIGNVGDLFFSKTFYDLNILYINMNNIFDRPHNFGTVFIDCHLGPNGTREYAKEIFNKCFKSIGELCFEPLYDTVISVEDEITKDNYLKTINDTDYFEYINMLKNIKSSIKGKIGSIVMNCNPFTLGHKFLIEEASNLVDFLCVFVVEEDKSFFPFKDRLNLVCNNVKHIKNVKVIPSGKFIISSITFPEYFLKDSPKNVSFDTSMDVEFFAKNIAPVLNISV